MSNFRTVKSEIIVQNLIIMGSVNSKRTHPPLINIVGHLLSCCSGGGEFVRKPLARGEAFVNCSRGSGKHCSFFNISLKNIPTLSHSILIASHYHNQFTYGRKTKQSMHHLKSLKEKALSF